MSNFMEAITMDFVKGDRPWPLLYLPMKNYSQREKVFGFPTTAALTRKVTDDDQKIVLYLGEGIGYSPSKIVEFDSLAELLMAGWIVD